MPLARRYLESEQSVAFDLQDDDDDEVGPPHLANSLLRNRHMRRAVFHAQPWLSNLRYNHLKGK